VWRNGNEEQQQLGFGCLFVSPTAFKLRYQCRNRLSPSQEAYLSSSVSHLRLRFVNWFIFLNGKVKWIDT